MVEKQLQRQWHTLGRDLRQIMLGLMTGAALVLPVPALAQDAARVAAGEAAWDKAGCLQCHGAAGEGGAGGESPAGPSLQKLDPNRTLLAETIGCGRPGTEMPAWLDGAYTQSPCFGLPKGSPPAGTVLTPVLSADEIQALVDFLLAKIVRK
jgi:mono/diheme cytochrome c family protein